MIFFSKPHCELGQYVFLPLKHVEYNDQYNKLYVFIDLKTNHLK